jgi:hypothetical protein
MNFKSEHTVTSLGKLIKVLSRNKYNFNYFVLGMVVMIDDINYKVKGTCWLDGFNNDGLFQIWVEEIK